jgi:UDP-2-acetamido-3-amino-2,3-dideoxy-glucuronate N-acetyltransferase
MNKETVIHPSAEISVGASIGAGTRIWQQCILLDGAVVGENCKLAHNVFVEGGVRIANGVTVKDNVALYEGVQIEDDVFIGPNAVFTNVKTPRAFILRREKYKTTIIAHGASIGANATIVCGVRVGQYALVGAGSVVTKDVPDFGLVAGNPARRTGWVSKAGHRLGADLVCPETQEKYTETDGELVLSATGAGT